MKTIVTKAAVGLTSAALLTGIGLVSAKTTKSDFDLTGLNNQVQTNTQNISTLNNKTDKLQDQSNQNSADISNLQKSTNTPAAAAPTPTHTTLATPPPAPAPAPPPAPTSSNKVHIGNFSTTYHTPPNPSVTTAFGECQRVWSDGKVDTLYPFSFTFTTQNEYNAHLVEAENTCNSAS